jgi:hypothetical protein
MTHPAAEGNRLQKTSAHDEVQNALLTMVTPPSGVPVGSGLAAPSSTDEEEVPIEDVMF